MSALIIDGKRIAEEIRTQIKTETKVLASQGKRPGLSVILVGDFSPSVTYVRNKEKFANEVGFYSTVERLPEETSQDALIKVIDRLNNDENIHGILVQLPLPRQIDASLAIQTIRPEKDVDCLHPYNIGKLILGEGWLQPCTPAGIIELLRWNNIRPSGKHVVVLGRSNIVGRPMSNMLSLKQEWADATVTVCHSRTPNIPEYTKQADILIVAIGQALMVTGDMVKEGAVVIDVGMNRIEDPSTKTGFRLVGDVNFDSAVKVASAITPVPGGVGPMTIAMLLKNGLQAAKKTWGML